MIDLDHFKWFNDSFGHLAGDELLVELGRVLERSLRTSDLACRWGGDEFLLMLPETSPDQSDVLLKRLDSALRAFLSPYEQDGIALGFSAGVARHPDDGTDLDALLRRADERLYSAKARLGDRRRELG
jgi:diguanylate cyclase (GGDEF)-like protein